MLDKQTLEWVQGKLAELEQAAANLPAREWAPGQAEQTAHLVGQMVGVSNAREWLRQEALKVRREDD